MNPVGTTVNLPGGIASGIAPGGSEYKTGAGATKITGARTVAGQTFYNIDQSGLGGGTGWINSSALAGGGAVPTSAPAAAPAPSSGPTSSMPSTPQAPAFDLVAATNAAYNTPEITAANKAITDRQAALATAQSGINDNPFYSEATRVGKSQMLTQQANNDIGVQQNILAGLKSDAAIKLNAAQGQYNINRQAYQDTLSQFNMILQAGGLTNASPQDLANFSVSTGIPMSEMQSIQAVQQKKDNPVSITTVSDPTGQYAVSIDSKGNVITKTQIGAPTATGSGGITAYEQAQLNAQGTKAGQDQWNTIIANAQKQLEAGVPWGDAWSYVRSQVPASVASPDAIDAALGVQWKQPGAHAAFVAGTMQ
jgi:hypothetical protein